MTILSVLLWLTTTMLPLAVSAQTVANGEASMVLEHVPATVAQQQQFYVDVALNPNGNDFNGLQGTVSFSDDTLSFVRAETGTSILNYFIETPTALVNTVHFSGIVPGGFKGLVNPFDPTHTMPGTIVRLVFAGKAPGSATITTSYVQATDNDGQGTLETVSDASAMLTVSSTVLPSTYATPDTIPPTIEASVIRDPNLFDDRYTLIFTATDKQSGINHVALQEGDGPWTTINSPYLLQDQTRQSILTVRAYDNAGNMSTITIVPSPVKSSAMIIISTIFIILILIFIATAYVIFRKIIHVHKHHQD